MVGASAQAGAWRSEVLPICMCLATVGWHRSDCMGPRLRICKHCVNADKPPGPCAQAATSIELRTRQKYFPQFSVLTLRSSSARILFQHSPTYRLAMASTMTARSMKISLQSRFAGAKLQQQVHSSQASADPGAPAGSLLQQDEGHSGMPPSQNVSRLRMYLMPTVAPPRSDL